MIRIVLIDDHALVREGISRLLEAQPDLRVVGSFGDCRAAVSFASREKPDLAIVDVAMPGINGIDVARSLLRASGQTRVLVLSMHANPEYVRQALLAGALGYVLKESAGQVLVDAVRSVHAGRRYLCEELEHESMQRYLLGTDPRGPLARLTLREQQVLRLTVEGMTTSEVALSLSISPKSVETYRSRIFAKLGIEGIPALVKFAIRYGVTTAG
ncbi:MAG: response regulator [Burkholderiales bacterium]